MKKRSFRLLSILLCIAIITSLCVFSVGAYDSYNGPRIDKIVINTKSVRAGDKIRITIYGSDDYDIVDPTSENWPWPCELQIGRIPKQGEVDKSESLYVIKKSEGVYEASCEVHDWFVSGDYCILNIRVQDKSGNTTYDNYEAENSKMPRDTIKVITSTTDATPPVVTKIEAQSKTVHEGDYIEIKVNAMDPSGISNIFGTMERDQARNDEYIYKNSNSFSQVDQNAYVIRFDIDDTWPTGTYHLNNITCQDFISNDGYCHKYVGYENNGDGIPNKLYPDATFTVETKWKDFQKPTVTNVEAESKIVRIGEDYSVIVHATDVSGIREENTGYISLMGMDTSKFDEIKAELKKVSGDTYKATFHIDESWEPAHYQLWNGMIADTNGYEQVFSSGDKNCPHAIITVIGKNEDISKVPVAYPDQNGEITYKPEDKNSPSGTSASTVFKDVPASGKWYSDAVSYAAEKGYMSGTGNNKFEPDQKVTRAQIAQILYAAEGKPAIHNTSKFSDVPSGKWYSDAVTWAASQGIVSGYPDGSFKPSVNITREQMVAIMYKYTQMKGYDDSQNGDLSKYPDQSKISKYAIPGMKWAVGHKVISGTNRGIEPKGQATRAQIAVILQSYDKNVRK